ncbi:GMC family oxidoreductase [Sandaracinobacteroides sp. A072]|uniref:GMC family oxidoreductase n=1 Tax=Sandaracinobacteroides sp. A072 TaxID=3461146 RepID=UPI00404341B5
MMDFDYVIVGAGSAGCVLANRLTADGRHRVLLLEAGPKDWNPMIHIPVGYSTTLKDPSVNWLYETEPDPGSMDRVHVWPRGKVLGGSSSINGLLYVRGQMADYDNWAQLGATGWSSSDVLPYFRRAEANERLSDDLHGTDGPLNVSDATTRHPVSDAVVEAGVQAGLPFNDDVNGEVQDGISYFQLTVKNGRRWSTAQGYLKPALNRRNLHVETEAHVASILFDGKRATGVTYRQDGRTVTAMARREVILCGGAVNSPQLLEVNGIGDPEVLKAAGIDVRHALPGVGKNLQDHFVVSVQFRLKPGTITVNQLSKGWRVMVEALKYAATRKGLLTLSAAHVQAYWRSRPGLSGPDVQYHILPATVNIPKYRDTGVWELEDESGLTIAPCQLRPESRGTIHVKSPDPFAAPAIRPNYLADPIDQRTIVEGVKFASVIAAQDALKPWMEHRIDPADGAMGDDEILSWVRERGSTIYHPVGTCRMGQASDTGAVVDPQGRVHGLSGLRVVDASVMPRLVSGNTNAPTIMIAEKISDSILADAKAEAAA